ncbi:unnamed protein product [Symbiodinium microadriaticum]|nr:unnamed protein product [Symbiodinium microadriaticum]
MARTPGPRHNRLGKTLRICCVLIVCIWLSGLHGDPLNLVDEEAIWDSIFSQDAAAEAIPQILATECIRQEPPVQQHRSTRQEAQFSRFLAMLRGNYIFVLVWALKLAPAPFERNPEMIFVHSLSAAMLAVLSSKLQSPL